jgi:hypothetical protein
MVTPPDYLPQIVSGLFVLGGVLAGGLVTTGVTLFSAWLTRHHERKALAGAVAAEVDAYISFISRRKPIEYIEGIARANEKAAEIGAKAVLPKNWITGYEQSRDIFPVLTASLPKIGILGPICRDISEFYNLVYGVRTTIISIGEGNFENATPRDVVTIIRSEIALWNEAMIIGRRMVERLSKIARNKRPNLR